MKEELFSTYLWQNSPEAVLKIISEGISKELDATTTGTFQVTIKKTGSGEDSLLAVLMSCVQWNEEYKRINCLVGDPYCFTWAKKVLKDFQEGSKVNSEDFKYVPQEEDYVETCVVLNKTQENSE